MILNRHLQKTRLRADRKYHDNIVRSIYDSPGCLGIPGLKSENIIWKAADYHYMHGTGHKNLGKYEVCPGPDLVFLFTGESLNFLVLEVKGSILGRSHVEAEHQLTRAEAYFRGFWKAVLVNQAKKDLLTKLGEFPYMDVFLSVAEIARENLQPDYNVLPHRMGIYLGKVSGSAAGYRVTFAPDSVNGPPGPALEASAISHGKAG